MVGAPRRVQPRRQAAPCHLVEHRPELRAVERLLVDVRVDLSAFGAQRGSGSIQFLDGLVRVVHRQAGAERDEALRMLVHELRQAIVDDSRHQRRLVRTRERLHGRLRKRQHLTEFAELVHGPKPGVQVHDRREVLDALAHVLEAGADVDVLVEEPSRVEVIEDVDFHSVTIRSEMKAALG